MGLLVTDFGRILGRHEPPIPAGKGHFRKTEGNAMTRLIGAVALGLTMAISAALPAVAAVVVTVNGQPISDVEISQRLKLMQLEGRSGSANAKKELIDEALMLQEAARLNIEI